MREIYFEEMTIIINCGIQTIKITGHGLEQLSPTGRDGLQINYPPGIYSIIKRDRWVSLEYTGWNYLIVSEAGSRSLTRNIETTLTGRVVRAWTKRQGKVCGIYRQDKHWWYKNNQLIIN